MTSGKTVGFLFKGKYMDQSLDMNRLTLRTGWFPKDRLRVFALAPEMTWSWNANGLKAHAGRLQTGTAQSGVEALKPSLDRPCTTRKASHVRRHDWQHPAPC